MRALGVRAVVCLAIGLGAVACGDSPVVYVTRLPPDAGPDATVLDPSCGCLTGACGADLSADALRGNAASFATFNAALDEGSAPHGAERLPLIIEALRKLPVDVVCLQEVWREEDAAAMKSSLQEAYPYTLVEKLPTGAPRAAGQLLGNGLLLLSRKPLGQPGFTPMNTTVAQRGALRASIGDATVLCTQLPGDQPGPYPAGKPYKSWAEEQAGAIVALKAAAPKSGCTVILGDLKTGPAGAGLTPVQAANYQSVTAGFSELWNEPACTVCSENPLSGSAVDQWTDHILSRGCRTMVYSRILDGTTLIKAGGQTLESRLSSHYGVEARLR